MKLPLDFNPAEFNEIPYGKFNQLFDDERLNEVANESIRLHLQKKLGCGVVSRSDVASRFGVRKRGYTMEQINSGEVKVR